MAAKKSTHLAYLYSLVIGRKKILIFAFLLMIAATVSRVIEPYLYKVIVDTLQEALTTVFTAEHQKTLIIAILIWVVLAIVANIAAAQQSFISWKLASEASQETHLKGYKRLLNLDYEEHIRKQSSELTKIVDDADVSTFEIIDWWISRFIPAGFGFVVMLILALSISWQMTIVALIMIPPYLFFIVYLLKKYRNKQRDVNKMWQLKHEHMADQVANIVTYKLNEEENIFMETQKQYSDRAHNAQQEMNRKWRITEMLNLDAVARLLVMSVGIYFVLQKTITLGTLFMFLGLLGEIFIPLHILSEILPSYSRRARYIDQFIEMLRIEDKVINKNASALKRAIKGDIEFKNVSFRYRGKEEGFFTLKNVSFKIESGKSLAIVGHSGAGKTTISGLLTRLFDVSKGTVLIDGIDIREYDSVYLKQNIGAVLQENSLYNETVRQNIAYGKIGATMEEIIAAAKKAAAHDFINKLPKKYDTLIGERGVRLSGGEKQRIAIARAMIKNPKIVVLDEPTSSLDSITEQEVQKGLKVLSAGRTVIIIAHRLSTVKHADKILVLNNGEVVASGTHAELLQSCVLYQKMVELQTGGFLAE